MIKVTNENTRNPHMDKNATCVIIIQCVFLEECLEEFDKLKIFYIEEH